MIEDMMIDGERGSGVRKCRCFYCKLLQTWSRDQLQPKRDYTDLPIAVVLQLLSFDSQSTDEAVKYTAQLFQCSRLRVERARDKLGEDAEATVLLIRHVRSQGEHIDWSSVLRQMRGNLSCCYGVLRVGPGLFPAAHDGLHLTDAGQGYF